MLDTYLTIDTEIWCHGWKDIDKKFPDYFSHYIYGKTSKGDYGLPFQLKLLNEYGLKGVFFVEPLFATRFGTSPLEEVIGLIQEGGQEVQMHLHTEWVNEAKDPIFPNITEKRQYLKLFTFEEQKKLITIGLELLNKAGSKPINAFRAGSFAANNDTLKALTDNNILIDSSYNSVLPEKCAIQYPKILSQAERINNIIEYPISVYSDYRNHYRHAQIGACSFEELSSLILQANEKSWNSFVILFHSSEFLSDDKKKPNLIVIKRFERLCDFLDKHRKEINTQWFKLSPKTPDKASNHNLSSSLFKTTHRITEQLVSRLLY